MGTVGDGSWADGRPGFDGTLDGSGATMTETRTDILGILKVQD